MTLLIRTPHVYSNLYYVAPCTYDTSRATSSPFLLRRVKMCRNGSNWVAMLLSSNIAWFRTLHWIAETGGNSAQLS